VICSSSPTIPHPCKSTIVEHSNVKQSTALYILCRLQCSAMPTHERHVSSPIWGPRPDRPAMPLDSGHMDICGCHARPRWTRPPSSMHFDVICLRFILRKDATASLSQLVFADKLHCGASARTIMYVKKELVEFCVATISKIFVSSHGRHSEHHEDPSPLLNDCRSQVGTRLSYESAYPRALQELRGSRQPIAGWATARRPE
jgi:hypothetical protein